MAQIRFPASSGAGPIGFGKVFTLVMMAGSYLVGYLHGTSNSSQLSTSNSSSLSSLLLCPPAPSNTNVAATTTTTGQQREAAQLENKDAKFTLGRDGWKAINVFYGNEDHLSKNWINANDKDKKWYSQSKQDQVIVALLRGKRDGYFLDLAANHALRLSNSYTLEQSYGWNGLCIEPNPRYWMELAYRRCQVAAAVVGKHRMEEISYSFPKIGAYGGIVREGFDQQGADKSVTEKRYTVPLQEILERASVPQVIDYFSLDVEGAEWYIMEGFPFDQYKVKIMTVERPKSELKMLLEKYNYQYVAKIAGFGETLWVHKEFASDLDMEAFHKLNVTMSQ